MRTAVLLLIFNRPDTTQQVFEAIRRARPSRLYVAADGPRQDRPGERERCESVREIATDIDWPCELHTLFRTTNLGCKMAVSGGISWFFEHEAEGIILEDDVLPDPTFFRFCGELLERYRLEAKVMMISGNYLLGPKQRPATSYYFSRYTHIWGWATWRRAWAHYDREMHQWPKLKPTDFLLRVGGGARDFQRHWSRIFDATHGNQVDTWDYQWFFASLVQNGLTAMPSKNLVKNIGFGTDATHTTSDAGALGRLPLETMRFPLDHPTAIARNTWADRWEDLHIFGTRAPLLARLRALVPGRRRVASVLRRLR
jgi:hypothetical protein